MISVSNSAYVDWLTCRRKYLNAYIDKIEPRRKSKALAIGIIGHDCLRVYYEARKNGLPHDTAKEAVNELLSDYLNNRSDEYEFIYTMTVKRVLDMYFDFYGEDPDWEILAVEKYYKLPLTPEFHLPMRLDLLIRERSNGKIFVVDSKFTYDFWQPIKENLSPQFPKYLAILRANGITVHGVKANQLRYREIKKPAGHQLFRRVDIPISDHKIRTVLTEHITASKQIQTFHSVPRDVQERIAIRLLKDTTCQYCAFSSLCEAELDGGDTTSLRESKFQQNTYGYTQSDFEDSL